MKVALCTPLDHRSAIGRVSIRVSQELARRGHTVTLINIERSPSPKSENHDKWYSWEEPKAAAELSLADVIVVQIGDNYQYHAGAIQLLQNFRCVGVFHDANIYNLFHMWAFDGRSDADGRQACESEIRRLYGDAADMSPASHSYDMIRWLAVHCAAALVHATFYKTQVQAYCPGTVMSTPLTYDAQPVNSAEKEVSTKSSLCVLTIGNINPNKCCDQVIEAIGRLQFRSHVEYRLVGEISDEERNRLARLAASNNVTVTFLGRVDDAIIAQEFDRADIVCCLRKPILEGASASAIEAMLSVRPIIVADAGFYAEIADTAAYKVPADFDTDDVKKALEDLIEKAELRRQIARDGHAWATSNCNVRNYVDKLEELSLAAISVQPYLSLANTYATQLQHLGFDQNDAIYFEAADTLQNLCKLEAD